MRNSMDYVRKLADPTYDTQTTSVPKFKLAYPKDSIHDLSKTYFKIPSDAVAQTGEQRPIRVYKTFQLDEHRNLVKKHTKFYKEKSVALGHLDKKIMAAVLFSLVAMHTPFIPFIGLAAIAGWMAALYWMNQRASLYLEYYDALLLLVATCSWCLGPDNEDRSSNVIPQFALMEPQPLLADQAIQAMMDQLYLVLSKPQMSHLLSPGNWTQYRGIVESHDNRLQRRLSTFFGRNASQSSRVATVVNQELESLALKQRSAEFIRCLYGLNRGSGADFLRIFIHAVPDLGYAVWHATQTYFTEPVPTPTAMTPM